MNIKLNGKDYSTENTLTIEGLLKLLSLTTDGIAVEVNKEIVPRRRHALTVIREDDAVEIVRMSGGG
ncbi:MAG: sulfur carrier protein ThiS [Deltaproteobacteria bacterium]|nr:sulfur carrier protein ThiS [Deltaproteobacteria bacterium]